MNHIWHLNDVPKLPTFLGMVTVCPTPQTDQNRLLLITARLDQSHGAEKKLGPNPAWNTKKRFRSSFCGLHVCICVHIYIYIHTYMHTCMHPSIHPCMHACIHPSIHTYIHTYNKYLSIQQRVQVCFRKFLPFLKHPAGRLIANWLPWLQLPVSHTAQESLDHLGTLQYRLGPECIGVQQYELWISMRLCVVSHLRWLT